MKENLKKNILTLVSAVRNIFVSSLDTEGYPNTKAMFRREIDGIRRFYFSTNLSSRRTKIFMESHKACIYFCDPGSVSGLMLVGDMHVRTDRETRERIWRGGDEMYYPTGIDDSDYCVLEFNTKRGNYYNFGIKLDFSIEEFETEE